MFQMNEFGQHLLHHMAIEENVREFTRQRRLTRLLADPEQQARRKFFRMYQVRHILFRLAPRLAARILL